MFNLPWRLIGFGVLLLAILGGLWAFHWWSFSQGALACETAHTKAALAATQDVLDTAALQSAADASLGLRSTNDVNVEREASAARLDRIATAPLTPAPGAADATSCPDVLGPAFWCLYDGEAACGGTSAPAAGPAAGVPDGG